MSGRRSLLGGAAALLSVPAVQAAASVPSPDARLAAIGREALPLLQQYERHSDEWFAAMPDAPDINRIGDVGAAIYDRLDVLRDQAAGLTATSLAGFQAKAVFLRIDMLIECARKGGMEFDGTYQECLWEFLGEMTKGGAA